MPDYGSHLKPEEATRRLGVLDIGSNSVRLVIYELYGANFSPIYNEKILAGLGRDLSQTGQLSQSGKESALAALKAVQTDSGFAKITSCTYRSDSGAAQCFGRPSFYCSGQARDRV